MLSNSYTRFLMYSFCASAILTGGANGLYADTLPLGDTYTAAVLANSSGDICEQYDVNSSTCSFGGSTASAIAANGQGGKASVSISGSTSAGAALTEYYFGLLGPKTEDVPILINGYSSTTDGGNGDSFGYAWYLLYQGSTKGYNYVDDFFASPTACAYLSSDDIPCLSTGKFTLKTSVTSNSVIAVLFWAEAYGSNSSALIDPTISIDPSFADAGDFKVVANSGVLPSPVSNIPEPAYTPAVAAFGLALSALGRLRRSTKA